MARACAHLAAGRYSEAIGAFRAALGLDPSAVVACLGMAEAMAAQGRDGDAVAGLVEGADRCHDHADAITLLGRALGLDASRIDLHLPIARLEHAQGQRESAVARIEGLAEQYMEAGHTQRAAELLRLAAKWSESRRSTRNDPPRAAAPGPRDDDATVIARNPLLSPPSRASIARLQTAYDEPEPDAKTTIATAPRRAPLDGYDPDAVTRVRASISVRTSASPRRREPDDDVTVRVPRPRVADRGAL